ncbi:MAG TPA: tlde1 domain-containing protein [Candidatus Sulfotelmatobacter sp.]|nr:tlde1 domain-containing protein [Candidatus Sulfotelmatobacter sp.]
MWTYRQSTGQLTDPDGTLVATGYSGHGDGKNNPALQDAHDIGPIPQGLYSIGSPTDLTGGPHGPYVLPLTPDPGNEMFGRSGFLMHGDSMGHPGEASLGCIIAPRPARVKVAESGDQALQVVE